jgi:hypothetical protein
MHEQINFCLAFASLDFNFAAFLAFLECRSCHLPSRGSDLALHRESSDHCWAFRRPTKGGKEIYVRTSEGL